VELRQLEYFVAVAEDRHFGRAAERLHIGQPAVSQQIRRLERELGADLLDRSPRHVRLTTAGECFLPEAKAVLAAVARAAAAVAGHAAARAATLRIGTSAGLGVHLDRVLDELVTLAPDLAVDLVSAPTRARLQQVAAGELDAAFLRGGSDSAAATAVPGVRAISVWRDPLLAVLPARHPFAQADAVALADIAALPLRLTPRRTNPALVDLIVGACHDAGVQPVPGPNSVNLEDTMTAIGVAPPSWTVVYASHAARLQTSRLAFLPFRESDRLSLTTFLVTRLQDPTPHLDLLLKACAANDHDS
jgi:DNA-binding transcriptional LysR family regulator